MNAPTLAPRDVKEMLLKVAEVIIGSEEMLSQADRDLGDAGGEIPGVGKSHWIGERGT